jgi:hypothetical protein
LPGFARSTATRTQERRRRQEADAFRLQAPPRVLDRRCPLPGHARRGAVGRWHGLRHNDPGELFTGAARQLGDAQTGPYNAFLSVLYRAIQHYGPPEAFVTDSGSIFLANRAQAIYRALGIRKLEIEKGQPWQSYLQTAWGVQEHYAHQHRKKGKRSPSEVLSWVRTPRYQEEDLARAFFSARYTRTLDDLGYLILQRFRLYAEEGLAGTEVAVWVAEDSLTVEYGGEALCRYEVECEPANGVSSVVGRLRSVKAHTLFETSIIVAQLRLFDLGEVLGEEGWMQVLKLDEYALRQPRRPDELQQVLFPYTEAV